MVSDVTNRLNIRVPSHLLVITTSITVESIPTFLTELKSPGSDLLRFCSSSVLHLIQARSISHVRFSSFVLSPPVLPHTYFEKPNILMTYCLFQLLPALSDK